MKKRKTKYIALFLIVVLAVGIPTGVYAVKNGTSPTSSAGGYFSAIVDRVDITLSKTDFSFTKTQDGTQTFLLTAELTIKKGEPDIYACIHSVDVNGAKCNYVLFTPGAENGSEAAPNELILRSAEKRTWNVEISVDIAAKTTITPELTIDFSSGLTQETADEHLTSIPLNITVK